MDVRVEMGEDDFRIIVGSDESERVSYGGAAILDTRDGTVYCAADPEAETQTAYLVTSKSELPTSIEDVEFVEGGEEEEEEAGEGGEDEETEEDEPVEVQVPDDDSQESD